MLNQRSVRTMDKNVKKAIIEQKSCEGCYYNEKEVDLDRCDKCWRRPHYPKSNLDSGRHFVFSPGDKYITEAEVIHNRAWKRGMGKEIIDDGIAPKGIIYKGSGHSYTKRELKRLEKLGEEPKKRRRQWL
jgi:hypothetical protein